MHLKNLQEKIRIDWYYHNELDSQLQLQVLNNNWRTYASKQLDHSRLGSWRVELIDDRKTGWQSESLTSYRINSCME